MISPHPNFSVNFALTAVDGSRSQVKNIKLEVSGKEFYDFDYRLNYQMYGVNQAFAVNGIVSLFLNIEKYRSSDSGLIPFNRSFYPVFATVEFDSLSQDHTLEIFEEFRTNFPIDSKGNIGLSDDQDVVSQWEASLEITTSSNLGTDTT